MRKTKTSSAVKDRYNRKHYEQVILRTACGGREAIQKQAKLRGLSVAAYLRHLIIIDGEKLGNSEISAIIGGGGQELKSTAEHSQRQLGSFSGD
jgi:hypothetical protein